MLVCSQTYLCSYVDDRSEFRTHRDSSLRELY